MMELVLYQFWRSSASWRVRWALVHKGAPFRVVSVDLEAHEQDGEAHRANSPIGSVPALVVDGRALTESVAIVEWLEETIPEPPLYPRDPWARARVRQIVELVNAATQPYQIGVVRERHSPDAEEQAAWVRFFNERGLAAIERLLGVIAQEPGAGRFAVGDRLTAADIFLVPQIAHARRFGVDVSQYPRVLDVERAALDTPHADATRPDRQPGAPRS